MINLIAKICPNCQTLVTIHSDNNACCKTKIKIPNSPFFVEFYCYSISSELKELSQIKLGEKFLIVENEVSETKVSIYNPADEYLSMGKTVLETKYTSKSAKEISNLICIM